MLQNGHVSTDLSQATQRRYPQAIGGQLRERNKSLIGVTHVSNASGIGRACGHRLAQCHFEVNLCIEQFAQHELQNATVSVVLRLGRSIDTHPQRSGALVCVTTGYDQFDFLGDALSSKAPNRERLLTSYAKGLR